MTYIAPTWSWASVDGEVVYYNDALDMISGFTGQIIANLLDYHLEYQSSNTFGQFKAGTVQLRGPLHEVNQGSDDSIGTERPLYPDTQWYIPRARKPHHSLIIAFWMMLPTRKAKSKILQARSSVLYFLCTHKRDPILSRQ